jgi:dipeptidase D
MTRKLSQLEPDKVFEFFEDLCMIPHGSGNTTAVSDYCVRFAQKRGLRYIKDEHNNVIIYKAASNGYEDHPGVIIQGHLDMVCEKEPSSSHDFERDGLNIIVEDGFVRADKTTLGGDDGIAVAYALAVLDDDTIAHPPIEAVFTVDEEVGMLGADAMDMSQLSGKYLLNIDSEEEGVFLTSCAGGMRADISLPVGYIPVDEEMNQYRIELTGFEGGHSGTEIDKYHANAHIVFGRLLFALNANVRYSIAGITGGTKDNAIGSHVCADIMAHKEDEDILFEIAEIVNNEILSEYHGSDDNIKITVSKTDKTYDRMISLKTREKLTFILVNAPDGVVKMSQDIKGMVETSLNCGMLKLTDNAIELGYLIRSSIESAKLFIYHKLEYIADFLGCEISYSGEYPGWNFRQNSELRRIMTQVYKEQYKKEPVVTAIHAGLECGIFADKIDDVDIVSLGPDIYDIHTPRERLDIESVKRVWKFLLEVLKRL